MTWLSVVILSVVEGITEFLPISSTGHMIIARFFLGLPEECGALSDPAIHLECERIDAFLVIIQAGAILAVITLFGELLIRWVKAWVDYLKPCSSENSELKANFAADRAQSIGVALSVAPFAVIGFCFEDFIKNLFSIKVVAFALIFGAVVILISEMIFNKRRGEERAFHDLTFKDSILIGCAECLALWPGFSRSAATIIGARALGFNKASAAEISFLVGLPALLGAAGYETLKSVHVLDQSWYIYIVVGMLISWVVAYVCVRSFVAFLKRFSLTSFAYYRLIVGFGILWWISLT